VRYLLTGLTIVNFSSRTQRHGVSELVYYDAGQNARY